MPHDKFNCIFCGKKFLSLSRLETHFNVKHFEVKLKERKEIIEDIKIELHKKSLREELKIARKSIKQQECDGEIVKKEIIEKYRNEVLKKLISLKTKEPVISGVKLAKTIEKIKKCIAYGLSIQNLQKFPEIEKVIAIKTKQKKRPKRKSGFTTTTKSVFVVYTPMGNKR